LHILNISKQSALYSSVK